MGSNAIRTSHNPVSPAMLDLCDRMGMLVIEENRLMGINKEHVDLLGRMIKRDRNHPCIICGVSETKSGHSKETNADCVLLSR